MISSDTIATVEASLRDNAVGRDIIAKVINDLKTAAQQEKDAREPAVKTPMQYAIVVSDPNGILKGHELVGWVLQMEESGPIGTVLERVKQAGYAFNATRKGQLLPVKTIPECFEDVPAKVWKGIAGADTKTVVKTKTPVFVTRTDLALPTSS